MRDENEILDFLRQVFSDYEEHTSGELCELLSKKFNLSKTQAMRRVSKLYAAEEITKTHRGRFQKVIPEPEQELYDAYCSICNTLMNFPMNDLDTSDLSEPFRLAYCELYVLWIKVVSIMKMMEEDCNE